MILARYPTDLTDTQWTVLEPAAKAGGRPRTTDMREVVNAVFYVLRGVIPHRVPPAVRPSKVFICCCSKLIRMVI